MDGRLDWRAPAFGPDRFFVQPGAASWLSESVKTGQSVSVFGGARIGKTSLLRQSGCLSWQRSAVVSARRLDPVEDAVRWLLTQSRDQGLSEEERLFLFVDDADLLAGSDGRPYLARLATIATDGLEGHPVSVCLAGTRLWRDATLSPGCPFAQADVRLSSFPLSVWDRSDVLAFLGGTVGVLDLDRIDRLTRMAGHHPFLLKGLISRWPDLDASLEACRDDFERAFASWNDQMSPGSDPAAEGVEGHALMRYLVEKGSAVLFDEAKEDLNRPSLKEEADLLCWLGVIERRPRREAGTGTVHATSGLFNRWYTARSTV